MRILFICSDENSCRSLIAQELMKSMDAQLEVFAASSGACHAIEPDVLELLHQMNIQPDLHELKDLSDLPAVEFDYVITLCEGTAEEFDQLEIRYRKKIHLGLKNPDGPHAKGKTRKEAYGFFVEELKTELDYFYEYQLKEKMTE